MRTPSAALGAVLVLSAALSACGAQEASPPPVVRQAPPVAAATPPATAAPALVANNVSAGVDSSANTSMATSEDAGAAPEAAATVVRVDVEKDSPAALVRGRDGSPPRAVFIPGVCSNAYAYLAAFPEAARTHGGIVAIDGDRPCGAAGGGYHSFSWDPVRQDVRVRAALAAAGGDGEEPQGLTLVGYSAGAGIGELMVQRWPKRYTRVVLIGAPSDPSTARLGQALGVVTMSCSRDVPGRMRDAARRLTAAGVPARYLEMPGCTHGSVADAEHVFGTAFDWLADNARPAPVAAAP